MDIYNDNLFAEIILFKRNAIVTSYNIYLIKDLVSRLRGINPFINCTRRIKYTNLPFDSTQKSASCLEKNNILIWPKIICIIFIYILFIYLFIGSEVLKYEKVDNSWTFVLVLVEGMHIIYFVHNFTL